MRNTIITFCLSNEQSKQGEIKSNKKQMLIELKYFYNASRVLARVSLNQNNN